jgi:hypothetical protein
MVGYPEPQPGLVISYSFLWSEEAEQGQVEGRKDRPCAIIIALDGTESNKPKQVAVVPITHSPPGDPGVAIEIPRRLKEHLGLDSERSWVILDEFNVFAWPGYDLRPIRGRDGHVDYGFLPPRFFDQLIERIRLLDEQGAIARTPRDE